MGNRLRMLLAPLALMAGSHATAQANPFSPVDACIAAPAFTVSEDAYPKVLAVGEVELSEAQAWYSGLDWMPEAHRSLLAHSGLEIIVHNDPASEIEQFSHLVDGNIIAVPTDPNYGSIDGTSAFYDRTSNRISHRPELLDEMGTSSVDVYLHEAYHALDTILGNLSLQDEYQAAAAGTIGPELERYLESPRYADRDPEDVADLVYLESFAEHGASYAKGVILEPEVSAYMDWLFGLTPLELTELAYPDAMWCPVGGQSAATDLKD